MKNFGMQAKADLKCFLDYVIVGLDHKYAWPSCSNAFSTLCKDNAETLQEFTGEVIEKTIPYPANEWSAKQH